jgi:cell division protein ZapA (FtsZ GTPase activity inhibitor)
LSKDITFHINNEAYTIAIGEDSENHLRDSLKKFLATDKNLNTSELLLAYLRKSQELVTLEHEIQEELKKVPSLKEFTI